MPYPHGKANPRSIGICLLRGWADSPDFPTKNGGEPVDNQATWQLPYAATLWRVLGNYTNESSQNMSVSLKGDHKQKYHHKNWWKLVSCHFLSGILQQINEVWHLQVYGGHLWCHWTMWKVRYQGWKLHSDGCPPGTQVIEKPVFKPYLLGVVGGVVLGNS